MDAEVVGDDLHVQEPKDEQRDSDHADEGKHNQDEARKPVRREVSRATWPPPALCGSGGGSVAIRCDLTPPGSSALASALDLTGGSAGSARSPAESGAGRISRGRVGIACASCIGRTATGRHARAARQVSAAYRIVVSRFESGSRHSQRLRGAVPAFRCGVADRESGVQEGDRPPAIPDLGTSRKPHAQLRFPPILARRRSASETPAATAQIVVHADAVTARLGAPAPDRPRRHGCVHQASCRRVRLGSWSLLVRSLACRR